MYKTVTFLLVILLVGCSCSQIPQEADTPVQIKQENQRVVRGEPTGTPTKVIEEDIVTNYVGELPQERPSDLNRRYKSDVFDFELYYPHDWTPNVQEKNIIFVHPTKDMMFSVEVIMTATKGGVMTDLESVQDSYYVQLDSLDPVIVNSVYRDVHGSKMLDCSFRYTYNKKDYVNRFTIGETTDYFYVLQFMVPADDYDGELDFLEAVINSFKYN